MSAYSMSTQLPQVMHIAREQTSAKVQLDCMHSISWNCRHLMTMPPAVFLEKVAALRKGMASEEGEMAIPPSMRFRRPAGRYADSVQVATSSCVDKKKQGDCCRCSSRRQHTLLSSNMTCYLHDPFPSSCAGRSPCCSWEQDGWCWQTRRNRMHETLSPVKACWRCDSSLSAL